MAERPDRTRLDKWLWHARFFKTRGLATRLVSGGHVRVNGEKVSKAALSVGPGDVLTFPQAREVRVVRITAIALRRGPAAEARMLYEDLAPSTAPEPRPRGGGERPTKRDRRAIDALKADREG